MSFLLVKNEARVIAALASCAFFILFLLPVGSGIVNIGNAAGAAVSLILTGIFLFNGSFMKLVSRMWERPFGKAAVCTVGGLFLAGVITAAVISGFMVREMRDAPQSSSTTLVVLGCKVKDGRPSLMLKRRLDTAYDYLSEHEDVKAVVSGGQGEDEALSEAQCMRDYLVARGIDSERIFMEDKSVNTEENLRFSEKLIKDSSLCGDVTIVTDGFHQLRADLIARKLGMDARNISAHTPYWLLPTYWVREWFGVVYFIFFG